MTDTATTNQPTDAMKAETAIHNARVEAKNNITAAFDSAEQQGLALGFNDFVMIVAISAGPALSHIVMTAICDGYEFAQAEAKRKVKIAEAH